MTSESVLDLYNRFQENGIAVWIDGGWGVDALLGRQTREHADLDIAVHRKDNAKLHRLLENDNYKEEKRFDSSEYMYVMKNQAGKSVDIHAFEYDENGNSIYGIPYLFGSLTGTGVINGQEVNCIDPKFMLQFKTGYEPKEKDIQDVQALCEHFCFELPGRYASCKNLLIWEEECQLYQVGYNIMKLYWNNGYTTEAMRAILHYAAKNLGIKRVAGGHAKENLASAKVIEKLGFVYDRDDIAPHVDGIRYFDSREYYLDL